jgi:hypothetical protein
VLQCSRRVAALAPCCNKCVALHRVAPRCTKRVATAYSAPRVEFAQVKLERVHRRGDLRTRHQRAYAAASTHRYVASAQRHAAASA